MWAWFKAAGQEEAKALKVICAETLDHWTYEAGRGSGFEQWEKGSLGAPRLQTV